LKHRLHCCRLTDNLDSRHHQVETPSDPTLRSIRTHLKDALMTE